MLIFTNGKDIANLRRERDHIDLLLQNTNGAKLNIGDTRWLSMYILSGFRHKNYLTSIKRSRIRTSIIHLEREFWEISARPYWNEIEPEARSMIIRNNLFECNYIPTAYIEEAQKFIDNQTFIRNAFASIFEDDNLVNEALSFLYFLQ